MFKNLLLSLSLMISGTAFAGVSDLLPEDHKISPSEVESVTVLLEESEYQPLIVLVKATNGGSTDITSVMYPSRLYVGVHKTGEMFDVNGSYLLVRGLTKVKSATYNPKKAEALITYEWKNEELKTQSETIRVYLMDAAREALTAKSPDEQPYSLKSSIGVQNTKP